VFFSRYRELQGASGSKVTELHSDLKLKQFELDRLQMLYEETSQSLKQANVDTTKYQHKLEVDHFVRCVNVFSCLHCTLCVSQARLSNLLC
jgi:flagellin-specific chaperone FliS